MHGAGRKVGFSKCAEGPQSITKINKVKIKRGMILVMSLVSIRKIILVYGQKIQFMWMKKMDNYFKNLTMVPMKRLNKF